MSLDPGAKGVATQRPAGVDAIRNLWMTARAQSNAGRPRAAARSAGLALKRLRHQCPGETYLHARILLTLAYQESELGDLAGATALLDQAESIDPAVRPHVEANRGGLLVRTGRPDAAFEHFDRAISGFSRFNSNEAVEELAIALLNRGVLNMAAGRLTAAQADTEQAERAARQSGMDVTVFMATHNLGYVRFLAGDLPGALQTMASASEVMPAAATGVSALDRARVLVSAGLVAESREFVAQAVDSFAKNRATADLADALMVHAEIDLASGDPSSTRAHARRAVRIATARGNERASMVAQLLELRAAALSRRAKPSVAGARRDADQAGQLADLLLAADLGEDSLAAHLLQAEALLDANDDARAAEVVLAASVDGRSVAKQTLAIRLHTRLVTGRIELAAGRRTAGLSEIRRGLDDLADFQARFGSQDLQSAAAIHGRELARLGLRTAAGTGTPAAILQWLERARAATTRLPAVRPPLDPILADELGALRVADEQARAALLSGQRDPAADKRVAELRRRVRARSWMVSGSGRADRPPTLAAVQRLLAERQPDAGVVALFTGGAQIHALVITATRAKHLVLAERVELEASRHRLQGDLDLLADERIPGRLAAVAAGSMQQSLRRMGEAFEPVLGVLGSGPVLIAAVGPLATVPWLLLPGLGGRPVTVSSSVTRALAGWSSPVQHPAANGVLVVAGPDVTNGDKEARAIACLHAGARLLTGEQATGPAVLAAISPGGLVHIAAHGHHEVGNPLFSGVKLADGLLFGYDFAPNPALPGQVVLSSCDVGQTDERPGGEPLGLVAALVRSGVPTVITGTSRIGDSVAEAAMVGYHELLLTGVAPAAALAASVEVASAATGLPAPFSCFGAGL